MPSKFYLVMPYYNNGTMLERHFEEWAKFSSQAKERLHIVIVDDGSQRDPAYAHCRDVGIGISLFRIDVDIPWNWDGARNLAMLHGVPPEAPVLMTDIDHLLTTTNADRLVNMRIKRDRYFVPARLKVDGSEYKRHPNSWILNHDLFWLAGGYDERFSGFYGKDKAFRRAIDKVARRIETDEVALVLYGRDDIADASTTDYTRKEGEFYTANHPTIRSMLHDGKRPTSWCNFKWHRII